MVPASVSVVQKFFFDPKYTVEYSWVFISRKNTPKRRIINEPELEPILRYFGVKILYLEEMHVQEEVNIFSRVKGIIAIHGAGLTNMVYMKPGSKVIEIIHETHSQMFLLFYSLANLFQLDYSVIQGNSNPMKGLHIHDRDIYVDPQEFRQILETFL